MFRLTRIIVAVALAGCASARGRSGTPNGSASPQSPVPNPQSRAAQPPGNGYLVVVGGGPIPDVINRRFVDLAGGAGKARIVVLPMASESGAESGAEKAADYRKLGAEAVSLNLARTDAGADSVGR